MAPTLLSGDRDDSAFPCQALFSVAAITTLVACGCGSKAAPAPATTTPATTGTSSAGSAGAPGSATATTQAPGASGTPAQAALPAGYLPLFPFADLADVRAWQASYQSGGHQPWHRSPDLTATAFAAFLGCTDVTQDASSAVSGGDGHVAVGIKLPDGTISTAAIIHLVLFGSGTYAPWEVVGTDDRTFTVDRPAYGSTVPSPVTVGGTITGVDESIQVTCAHPVGAGTGGRLLLPGGRRHPQPVVGQRNVPRHARPGDHDRGRHRRARRRRGAVRRHRRPRRLTVSAGMVAGHAHTGRVLARLEAVTRAARLADAVPLPATPAQQPVRGLT